MFPDFLHKQKSRTISPLEPRTLLVATNASCWRIFRNTSKSRPWSMRLGRRNLTNRCCECRRLWKKTSELGSDFGVRERCVFFPIRRYKKHPESSKSQGRLCLSTHKQIIKVANKIPEGLDPTFPCHVFFLEGFGWNPTQCKCNWSSWGSLNYCIYSGKGGQPDIFQIL